MAVAVAVAVVGGLLARSKLKKCCSRPDLLTMMATDLLFMCLLG